MSKEISDKTFEFLKVSYANQVREFLDDPDGMCGNDAKQILAYYLELAAIGADIELVDNRTERLGGHSYFWEVVKLEGRTPYEINRLKAFLNEGNQRA